MNLKAVQELLVHANIKMTMRYVHLSQAQLQNAMAVLDNLSNGHLLDAQAQKNKKKNQFMISQPFYFIGLSY
jgi:hypothetical protein